MSLCACSAWTPRLALRTLLIHWALSRALAHSEAQYTQSNGTFTANADVRSALSTVSEALSADARCLDDLHKHTGHCGIPPRRWNIPVIAIYNLLLHSRAYEKPMQAASVYEQRALGPGHSLVQVLRHDGNLCFDASSPDLRTRSLRTLRAALHTYLAENTASMVCGVAISPS